MEEIWRKTPEKYGNYEVSNIGRIRNAKIKKIKNTRVHKTGYVYGKTKKDGKKINIKLHRVVAETFIPNPYNKPQVNHINGIKHDNRVENLEWCTHSENMQHARAIGLLSKTEKNVRKTEVLQISKDGVLLKQWKSIKEAANVLNLSESGISDVCRGYENRETCGGFIWKYVNAPFTHAKHKKSNNSNKKRTYVLDLDGNFLNEFDSLRESARFYNISSGAISYAIKNKNGVYLDKIFSFDK